ncbi:hypothetical protein ACFL4L_00525 [bacterium]
MKRSVKMMLYGFLIWLICFIIGFMVWPLYESQLMLYKTILIVCSVFVGMVFINLYFKTVTDKYVSESISLALVWLMMNWVLDLIFLVGLFKTPIGEYFISVGLRYLNIPIIVIGVGMLLEMKSREN